MTKLKEPLFKHLTSTGAVTTDNKAGILHKIIFCGEDAGDKLEVKDGATTQITLLTSTTLDPIIIDFKSGSRPIFTTDIDATITVTSGAFASFIYEELTS